MPSAFTWTTVPISRAAKSATTWACPARLGLYRMALMDQVLLAERSGQLVNLSGGAGAFKLQRGAEPVREYDAIFDGHLPRHRRLPWRILSLEGRMFGSGTRRFAPMSG